MRKTKDISTYILMILIMIVLACIVVLMLMLWFDNNKPIEIADMVEKINIIEETAIEVEGKEEKKQNVEDVPVVAPIITPEIVQEVEQEQIATVQESSEYKYYYYQLSDNAKNIYNVIEQNMDNMKSGTYVINLPNSVTNVLRQSGGQEALNQDFQSAWDAIIMDRVELFYIDISKIALNIQTITRGNDVSYNLSMGPGNSGDYLEYGFNNAQDVDMALAQVRNIRNQLISSANGSDYDKIKLLHDWLIDNLEYGTDVAGNNSYNIYGTFCIKNVVCEGYAEGFKYLLDSLGIPCILVSGTAQNSEGTTENHEWNYVQLGGSWYAVDVTWDDPIIMGGGFLPNSSRYKYFLKGSSTMNSNHFINGQVSNTGMTFSYPNLGQTDY